MLLGGAINIIFTVKCQTGFVLHNKYIVYRIETKQY